MPTSKAKEIHHIRRVVLDARRKLGREYRVTASEKITKRFVNSREFMAAKTIACYLPMADEVDTRAVIERAWRSNKRVFAPVIRSGSAMSFVELVRESTLERNQFGVWEPANGHETDARLLDLVIAPLVAFDDRGNRIGMGAGYFDRAFAFLRHRRSWLQPKLIGLAFDCQKVEKIKPNPWDIPLYRVYSDGA